MNRIKVLINIAALLVAAGCDANGASNAAATPEFRVALLTPGPISDKSWNGGAYDGLMAIRDSLGAQVSHIQTRTPAEFEENFRQYGAQGYTLVFGHGFEFQDAAARVAPDFPRTMYVTTSSNRTGPNIAALTFAFEEASYLAGVVAAHMTRSNVIGAIGGTELPPVRASFQAFADGARTVNPDVQVRISYIGNWEDVSAGKEQALAQISRGVDVIYQNADAAGLGVFQAVRETEGVYAIGANVNQNAIAPNVTLGSVVIDIPRAFMFVARGVKEQSFEPRVISFGVESEVVTLVLNPLLRENIPAAAIATLDSLEALMRAGEFTAPGERFGAPAKSAP